MIVAPHVFPREEAWDIARRASADRPMPDESRAAYLAGRWDAAPDVQLVATGAELAFRWLEDGQP